MKGFNVSPNTASNKLHSGSKMEDYQKVITDLDAIIQDPLLGNKLLTAERLYGGKRHKVEAARQHLMYILKKESMYDCVDGLLCFTHSKEVEYVLNTLIGQITYETTKTIITILEEYDISGGNFDIHNPLAIAHIHLLRHATKYIAHRCAIQSQEQISTGSLSESNNILIEKLIARGGVYTYTDFVGGEAEDLSEILLKEYIEHHFTLEEKQTINFEKKIYNTEKQTYKHKKLKDLDRKGQSIRIDHLEENGLIHTNGLSKEELNEYVKGYKFSLEMYQGIENKLRDAISNNTCEQLFKTIEKTIVDTTAPFIVYYEGIDYSQSQDGYFLLEENITTIGAELNSLKKDIMEKINENNPDYEFLFVDIDKKMFYNSQTTTTFDFDAMAEYIKENGYMFNNSGYNHKFYPEDICHVEIKVIPQYFGKDSVVAEVTWIIGENTNTITFPLLLLNIPINPTKIFPLIITIPDAVYESPTTKNLL